MVGQAKDGKAASVEEDARQLRVTNLAALTLFQFIRIQSEKTKTVIWAIDTAL
jgi:Ribonuclease G/E